MRATLYSVLVGACGGIAFAFLNNLTIALSGIYWWLALGAAFAVCFLGALAVGSHRKASADERERKRVGSGNKAGGNQGIEIGEATVSGGGDKEVGSHNIAKGDQNIKIKKVRL